ncbi:hypothetical protein RJ639_043281 [Escallonia herrerae]|uniref:Reverse transcriptase RNase H-like domain-containing protein n=1 Tax=Escallonia herrerae TaxID=1293975 RepID=A0AA89B490_9ASTE|nr:hypothetical protein RJ639_043281 [Escallonia herrerae]
MLKEFKDVFAWTYKEMPGLDPKVAEVHHLAIKSGVHPVKQAQHMFHPKVVLEIEVEINKLIEARLRETELKYNPIEKTCLALVFASQKLRHYFLAYTVHLILKVKYVMAKTVLSWCLAKWSILFNEFEIVYVPRTAIKGQALADFLADHPISAD